MDLSLGLKGGDALEEQVNLVLILKTLQHHNQQKSKHRNLITHSLVDHLELRLELRTKLNAGVC